MKTALILGITGGFGGYVARALLADGWNLKALVRNPARVSADLQQVDLIQGDATNIDDIRGAATDASVVIYGINVPYDKWESMAMPPLENTLQIAEHHGMTIVFPGNVYVFDPAEGPDFSESSEFHPPTRKGEIRRLMETRLQQASERGARVIIIRAGDFMGKVAPSTWMSYLVKKKGDVYNFQLTGKPDIQHSWAYLPDIATTVASLLKTTASLSAYEVFHFKGYQLSANELMQHLERATGVRVVRRQFPWFALRLLSPFVGVYRGLLEMRYLWNEEVNLNQSRLERQLQGSVKFTDIEAALQEIVHSS